MGNVEDLGNVEDSGIRFAARLQELTVDAEPEWLDDVSGITVTEHTSITELDEDTQNKLMRLYEAHAMKENKVI